MFIFVCLSFLSIYYIFLRVYFIFLYISMLLHMFYSLIWRRWTWWKSSPPERRAAGEFDHRMGCPLMTPSVALCLQHTPSSGAFNLKLDPLQVFRLLIKQINSDPKCFCWADVSMSLYMFMWLFCVYMYVLVGMIGEIDVHLRTEAWDFTHMWSKMYENKKKKKQAALSATRTLLMGTPCICHILRDRKPVH